MEAAHTPIWIIVGLAVILLAGMYRPRTLIWIIILLAVILLAGMCSRPLRIEGAPALFPPVNWLQTNVTNGGATYFYETDTGTVRGVHVSTSCPMRDAGVWTYDADRNIKVYHKGVEQITDTDATISVNDNIEPHELPWGFWFRVDTNPGAPSWRWAITEQEYIRHDLTRTPVQLLTPECGPFLPLVTAGPAELGPTVVILIGIGLIFAAWSNSRSKPRPPHR